MKSLALLLALLMGSAAAAAEPAFTSPMELFAKLYGEGRILAIAEATHLNSTGARALFMFLEKFGTDPNLKYVLLENSYVHDQNFQRLSIEDQPSLLSADSEFATGPLGYCLSPERAFVVANLPALIQKINRLRPPQRPLVIRTFDGIGQAEGKDFLHPERRPKWKYRAGNCTLSNPDYKFISSGDREHETADRFAPIWETIVREDAKAVLLYHQAHLIRDVNDCVTKRTGPDTFTSTREPMSWLGLHLQRKPEARSQIRTVALDERFGDSPPFGVFKFTAELSSNRPSVWGSVAASVPELPGMSSLNLFQPSYLYANYRDGSPVRWQNGVRFDQMFDAVLATAHAYTHYRMGAASIYRRECAQ